jgi:hypothetical protein
MVDYNSLISKFNLDEQKLQELSELHRFAKSCCIHNERIIVTTVVTDHTGKKVLNQEVQNVELV